MTLVRVLGSASPSEVRMTTWYGEQSGMESLLHNHPKNPDKYFSSVEKYLGLVKKYLGPVKKYLGPVKKYLGPVKKYLGPV